jgi:hypothetical protein
MATQEYVGGFNKSVAVNGRPLHFRNENEIQTFSTALGLTVEEQVGGQARELAHNVALFFQHNPDEDCAGRPRIYEWLRNHRATLTLVK